MHALASRRCGDLTQQAAPIFEGLERLSLARLTVSRLPEALATATRLRRLDLSYLRRLQLQCSDIVNVLQHLTALDHINLTGCHVPLDVAAQLSALPNITVVLPQR